MAGIYETVGTPSPGPYEKTDQLPLTGHSSNYKSPGVVRENFAVAEPNQAPMSPWRPGVFRSAPWLGIIALLVAIVCAVGAVASLLLADGKETSKWPTESQPIQLSVILAILMGVGNGALAFAHTEGATLTWWIRMMQGGPLSETHHVWQTGSSAWHSVLSYRHISKVSLASIFFLVLFIDGPLIQRAASFTTVTETTPKTLSVPVSTGMIDQDTGIFQTRANNINAMTGNFSRVVKDFTARSDIQLNIADCNGTCRGTLIAAGFDVKCKTTTDLIDSILVNPRGGAEVSIGNISIMATGGREPVTFELKTAFKPGPDRTLIRTNCTLRAAQVGYPVTFTNGTVTLDPIDIRSDNHTIAFGELLPEAAAVGFRSKLGGIAYAIENIYGSEVMLYFTRDWALLGQGMMQYTYINSTDEDLGSPKMTYSDPTTPVLEAVRELTFRAALAFSNETSPQKVEAAEERLVIKYQLQPSYLGGALAIIGVNALLVAWLFNEYWLLGRKVSMSPLEIATAFQAPITVGADTNAEADVLARQLQGRHIQYGATQAALGNGAIQKLAIASSDNVSWPARNR